MTAVMTTAMAFAMMTMSAAIMAFTMTLAVMITHHIRIIIQISSQEGCHLSVRISAGAAE